MNFSFQQNVRFGEFSKYLQQSPELCDKIQNSSDATILAPTNEAFRRLTGPQLEAGLGGAAERVLGLHLVHHPPAILTDDVRITRPQADTGVSEDFWKIYFYHQENWGILPRFYSFINEILCPD